MFIFSGFARKMNNISPLARAKRAREPAVWILCMVSKRFQRFQIEILEILWNY
ncbi:MAG: hypothetical protein U5L45_12115 [Saprospiraceae bacterium]|nr:hypothetical protein [Saprospiraceae bacterium]